MITKFFLLLGIVLATALAFPGCMVYQDYRTGSETAFNYPNSNVVPLGPVKVTIDGDSGLKTPLPTGAQDVKLYNAAVKSVNGATLVTDYIRTYKVYNFFIFYWSKMTIEGTASKAEVGNQVMH